MNGTNKGTGWTPSHCAAFQGHGKALLYLVQYQPDVTIRDSMGRYQREFFTCTLQVPPGLSSYAPSLPLWGQHTYIHVGLPDPAGTR